jgi:hypothetical protein
MGKWLDRLAAKVHAPAGNGTDRTADTPIQASEISEPALRGTVRTDDSLLCTLPAVAANDASRTVFETVNADRPYALALEVGHAAHARPWDDAAIRRFNGRVSRIRGFGFAEQDAEDIAERMALGDVGDDDRRSCLACAHLSGIRGPGFRCARPALAGLPGTGRDRAAIGTDFAVLLQRCRGFVEAGT